MTHPVESSGPSGPSAPEPEDATSFHVNRALRGDPTSLGWIVTRLTPFLKAQAAWRLGPVIRSQPEVEDIVSEAWLVTLRRIDDIVNDHGRSTPRLMTFLGTTVLNLANRRIDERLRMRKSPSPRLPDGEASLQAFADTITGAVTNAANNEASAAIQSALDDLSETDRQVIILRAVEGFSNQEAATQLGESPNTISHRYRRALDRLRKTLPPSFFDDFAED
jgi:RNA polymerase sigma factor (sigma-70 family)